MDGPFEIRLDFSQLALGYTPETSGSVTAPKECAGFSGNPFGLCSGVSLACGSSVRRSCGT